MLITQREEREHKNGHSYLQSFMLIADGWYIFHKLEVLRTMTDGGDVFHELEILQMLSV